MAVLKNGACLLVRYTPSVDAINPQLEKKGVIPEVVPRVSLELFPLLVRHGVRQDPRSKEVGDVGKPWVCLGHHTGRMGSHESRIMMDAGRVTLHAGRIKHVC